MCSQTTRLLVLIVWGKIYQIKKAFNKDSRDTSAFFFCLKIFLDASILAVPNNFGLISSGLLHGFHFKHFSCKTTQEPQIIR